MQKSSPYAAPISLTSAATRRSIDLRGVHLAEGFLGNWQNLNRDATIPHCISRIESSGVLDNFRRLIGESDAQFRGPLFADSDLYKLLEAIGWEAVRGNVDEFMPFVEESIRLMRLVQLENGYLDTYFQGPLANQILEDLSQSHELYKLGHLIQAAIAWAHAGDTRLLEIALKYVELVHKIFGENGRQEIDGHPEIETALVELTRYTGDGRHRELAKIMVERRGHSSIAEGEFGRAYYQDLVPVREAREATGHAVRQLYLMAGVADLELDEPGGGYQPALEALWDSVHTKKMYVTGGTGSRHRGEAFGDDYELPSDRAYSETCAAIANFQWNWRMLLLSGEARFADEMERGIYNAIAVSTSSNGQAFFYSNPLQLRTGHSHEEDAPSTRLDWFFCACCPPNLARLLASIGGYLLTESKSSIDFHLYSAGTYDLGGGAVFTVKTEYPWKSSIDVSTNVPTAKTTRFRIPAWAQGATISIDNGPDSEVGAGYAIVPAGFTSVTLNIPIQSVFEIAHSWVDAARGAVALRRGPVYYCLESADLSAGMHLEDVSISQQPILAEPEFNELLGVPIVRIEGAKRVQPAANLYSVLGENNQIEAVTSVAAIPYFRWANRTSGAMRVWIPTT